MGELSSVARYISIFFKDISIQWKLQTGHYECDNGCFLALNNRFWIYFKGISIQWNLQTFSLSITKYCPLTFRSEPMLLSCLRMLSCDPRKLCNLISYFVLTWRYPSFEGNDFCTRSFVDQKHHLGLCGIINPLFNLVSLIYLHTLYLIDHLSFYSIVSLSLFF